MKNRILKEFVKKYQLDRKDGISVVGTKELAQLKSADCSVEELFDYLNRYHQRLFHGSRADITDGILRTNREGKVYASKLGAIAIMRAIISNYGLNPPGLEYPYFIDKSHPLEVSIYGINDQTIGENGFVYILNQRGGFENNPWNSWQYTKTENVPISAKVEVIRNDFSYPIFDIKNQRRVQ